MEKELDFDMFTEIFSEYLLKKLNRTYNLLRFENIEYKHSISKKDVNEYEISIQRKEYGYSNLKLHTSDFYFILKNENNLIKFSTIKNRYGGLNELDELFVSFLFKISFKVRLCKELENAKEEIFKKYKLKAFFL